MPCFPHVLNEHDEVHCRLKWENACTCLIYNSSINVSYHFYRSSGPLSQKSLLQQPWQLNIWSLLVCLLRQEAQGFLGNASCVTTPKSQWLNPTYVHLLLMSQSSVNTPGALSQPMPCGSIYLLSGSSAISQDLPRILYWVLCFQLAKRKKRKRERERTSGASHLHIPICQNPGTRPQSNCKGSWNMKCSSASRKRK